MKLLLNPSVKPLLLRTTIVTAIALVMLAGAHRFGVTAQKADVDGAARLVGAALRTARSHAVTHKTHTAVLMPAAEFNAGGELSSDRYGNRSVRGCTLAGAPTGERTGAIRRGAFLAYLPNSEWRILPAGVFAATTTTGAAGTAIEARDGNVVDGVLFPEHGSGTIANAVRAVIFTPEGRTVIDAQNWHPGTGDTVIRIYAGERSADGRLQTVDDGSPIYRITVSHMTGEVSYAAKRF